MAYRVNIKGRPSYNLWTWEEIIQRYGITHYKHQMNHWESWIEVDFPSEKHYTMFKIEFGIE